MRSITVCLLVLLLVACGDDDRPPVESRTVILGFDGMDPTLVEQWMAAGLLPNFSKLAATGTYRPLATTNPPQSPVAWSSFATGGNPGEHGIFDFLRRQPDSYLVDTAITGFTPARSFSIGGMEIPYSDPEIFSRRQGEPFWNRVEADGGRATVLRVPVTFPPDPIHRMLAGMGVPDLLGSQGTYTLYSNRRIAAGTNDRVVFLRPNRAGEMVTTFAGPADPFEPAETLSVPLVITATDEQATVTLDETAINLSVGQWSDFTRVTFPVFGPLDVSGLVRFHLISAFPDLRLYVSPIQIDPYDPVVPLSSPPDYAADLATEIGLFHTIGMPEETWSLDSGHLTDAAFLEMERTILAEREAMFFSSLDKHDSDLVTGVFVQTDRVSHMFYRGIDPEHPLHDDASELARGAIEWVYGEADRILGQTMQRLGPNDRLLVISDHGFAPFRHAVHLNRWLVDAGYLVLNDGTQESGPGFVNVDWSQSRAYALGFNGVYINQLDREPQGWVEPDDAPRIAEEIVTALAHWNRSGEPVVNRALLGSDVYRGDHTAEAPDVVVGYNNGYRASWQTTLGAIPVEITEPNESRWSGDHCADPQLVPGVLFANFEVDDSVVGIEDIGDHLFP